MDTLLKWAFFERLLALVLLGFAFGFGFNKDKELRERMVPILSYIAALVIAVSFFETSYRIGSLPKDDTIFPLGLLFFTLVFATAALGSVLWGMIWCLNRLTIVVIGLFAFLHQAGTTVLSKKETPSPSVAVVEASLQELPPPKTGVWMDPPQSQEAVEVPVEIS